VVRLSEEGRTDFGVALHLQHLDALGDGGAGVVNDVDHGLGGKNVLVNAVRARAWLCRLLKARVCAGRVRRTFSWIILRLFSHHCDHNNAFRQPVRDGSS